MNALSPISSALLPWLLLGAARAQEAPVSVDKVLAEVRANSQVPGIAAAAVRDGRILAIGVAGVRELGKAQPIEKADRFVIGSCTKAMTRLLVGRLLQAGKIRPEATLPQLLPEVKMRDEYTKATLADLMRHTAGLPPYTRITPQLTPIFFELQGPPMEARSKFAEHVLQEAPAGTVGKDFVYSNAGYAILGNVAERRVGRPWETLITDEVFTPLKMTAVRIGLPDGPANPPVASGHERTPHGYELAKDSPPVTGLLAPAGGVVLGIEDFARFAIAEVAVERGDAGEFLGKETCTRLPPLRPKDSSGSEGEAFFGGQGTFTAAFAVWPSKSFAIVVATNGGDSDEVCQAALDAVRAACAPDVPAPPGVIRATGPAGGRFLGIQMRAGSDGSFVVVRVDPGSLAEKGGLRVGDQLAALDGKAISEWPQEEIAPAIRAPNARITVLRDGKKVEIEIP
jgi:CubicO group peptidase (beta-lactamase class C family)